MNIETEISSFVSRKDMVIPVKTLKAAKKDMAVYEWMRISHGYWLCQNGDKAYIVSTVGDKIGCSCPAMAFHCAGNDVCKHIAMVVSMQDLPQKPIPDMIAQELMKAGWIGDKGNLKPPQATSDEDGEDNEGTDPAPPDADKKPEPPAKITVTCPHCMKRATRNTQAEADAWLDSHPCKEGPRRNKTKEPESESPLGTKVFERTCPHCGVIEGRTSETDATAWLEGHVKACPKNPANQKIEPETTEPDKEEIQVEQTEQEKRIIASAEGFGAKDIDLAYVTKQIDALKRFRVPQAEAERSVVSAILRMQGLSRPKGKGAANQLMTVDQITSEGMWLNLKVKVTKLWDSSHESIRQSGVVGDESGTTRFTSWEVSNLPLLEIDKCYSIENVVSKEYEGKYSVGFTKNTTISVLDEAIEVGYSTTEFAGVLVDIQKGSGLIKRCPTCNRATKAGICEEHGAVKGIADLRIKGVLDDGITSKNCLLNQERTEFLTGISLEDAVAIATEALDANAVADKMRGMLIGREFRISGLDMGDTVLVECIDRVDAPVSAEAIEALMMEV